MAHNERALYGTITLREYPIVLKVKRTPTKKKKTYKINFHFPRYEQETENIRIAKISKWFKAIDAPDSVETRE